MKKLDLRSLIREEIKSTLLEYTINSLDVDRFSSGYGKRINPSLFAKMMPKTARTTKEAEERIRTFEGEPMFVHSQVYYASPKGNAPDRPMFYFGQSQLWLRGEDVNVTFLLVKDTTEAGLDWANIKGKVKDLGWAYVDTDVFLNEIKTSYELIKKTS